MLKERFDNITAIPRRCRDDLHLALSPLDIIRNQNDLAFQSWIESLESRSPTWGALFFWNTCVRDSGRRRRMGSSSVL